MYSRWLPLFGIYGKVPHTLETSCFVQSGFHATRLSSPLSRYTVHGDTTLVCEGRKFESSASGDIQTTVCLLVGCLTSQQQASVSQGRICSDNLTCCHTEIEVADQTFYLTQSQNTDTGPTSPSADPITPGAWQGSHWSANFEVTGMTRPRKNPGASGIRTRDLPLSRRTPYHLANEAVQTTEAFYQN